MVSVKSRLIAIIASSLALAAFFALGADAFSRYLGFDQNSLSRWLMIVGLVMIAGLLAFLLARRLVLMPLAALRNRIRDAGQADLASEDELAWLDRSVTTLIADRERLSRQKDEALREANHRVMNSLQTVGAMLKLQSISFSDPVMRNAFDEASARIQAIAMTYRRIETTSAGERIDFALLMNDICGAAPQSRRLEVEADPLILTLDEALPLSVIVSEFLSHEARHDAGRTSSSRFQLESLDGEGRIAMISSAVLPEGFAPEHPKDFGMQLVAAMVRQLRGTLKAVAIEGDVALCVNFRPSLVQGAGGPGPH